MTTLESGTWYDSRTIRYEVPEGSAYITIVVGSTGEVWIDCAAGKSGSYEQANAHAMAVLCGIALRFGAPPIKLVTALKEVTHEGSGDLILARRSGARVGLSISDALGDAIWRILL